jgi:TonB family protein
MRRITLIIACMAPSVLMTSAAHADDVLTQPKRLSSPPDYDFYPAEAKRQHQEGSGIVRVCFGIDGVAHTAIVSSTGYAMLDEAAQDSFRKFTWSPATRNGTPVEHCQVVRVSYCLKGTWDGSKCSANGTPMPPSNATLAIQSPAATRAAPPPDVVGEPTTTTPPNDCNPDHYPVEAKRLHQEGTVVVRVCVDTEGRPHPSVLQSSGFPLLDQGALREMLCARWKAATKDGKSVGDCKDVKVGYTLKGNSTPENPPRASGDTPETAPSALPAVPPATDPPPADPHP